MEIEIIIDDSESVFLIDIPKTCASKSEVEIHVVNELLLKGVTSKDNPRIGNVKFKPDTQRTTNNLFWISLPEWIKHELSQDICNRISRVEHIILKNISITPYYKGTNL